MDKPLTPKPAAQQIPLHEDLKVGADLLALAIYGKDTPETRRDIYRNPMGLPFFKHGLFIAGLMSEIHATIRERAAVKKEEQEEKRLLQMEEKRQKQAARISPKGRRRVRQSNHQVAAK